MTNPTFAEELESASPSACYEAREWVEEHPGLTENELWKICPRGDWLWWLLMDAFAIGEASLYGQLFQGMHPSLSAAVGYPENVDDEHLAGLADRIRKIFPEWPL